MLELAFRLQHACVFGKLSKEFPDVVFSNWCNFSMEILEYRARDAPHAERIQGSLGQLSKRGFKSLGKTVSNGLSQMVMMRCGHRRGTSVDELMEDAGCLVLYPVVYRDGWEHYRVVVLDETLLPKLFEDLRRRGQLEITMKRKSEHGLLSHSFLLLSGELFAELTAKQADALHTAIEHGYYKVPRKIRFEDIAKGKKVPRTTFEEHVRKAESKILNSLAPYVALYADAAR